MPGHEQKYYINKKINKTNHNYKMLLLLSPFVLATQTFALDGAPLNSLNHFDIYESGKEILRASMVISGSGNTGLR